MEEKECEYCIKRKTMYCPNSVFCLSTKDKPYYQNRIMLLEANATLQKQLSNKEAIIKEARECLKDYLCTEEYCGYVGLATTHFVEKLSSILDKANNDMH